MTDTFPSFRYGPDGAAAVFDSADDVPKGWFDHPSKVKGAPDPSEATSERRASRPEFQKRLKLLGVPFNPQASAAQLEQQLANLPETEEAEPEVSQHGPPAEGPTHVADNAFDHDGDGQPGGSKSPVEDLTDLRAEYKAKMGKKPFNGWDADTLREKMGDK